MFQKEALLSIVQFDLQENLHVFRRIDKTVNYCWVGLYEFLYSGESPFHSIEKLVESSERVVYFLRF